MRRLRRFAGPLLLLGSASCAAYRPAPLNPSALASAYRDRRVADSDFHRFLAGGAGLTPDSGWTPRALALVAVYFRPELDVARAAWREAVAGETTAGARPQPSAGLSVDRAARVDEGKTTPWSVALTGELTLETGGKRGIRIARARALVLASDLALQALAWQVAEDAAAAEAAAVGADQAEVNAIAERRQLDSILTLLRARYAQGAASLSDVARAEADVQAASVVAVAARQGRTAARAALARAAALPVSFTDSLTLASDPASSCVVLDSVPAAALERRALERRADLGAGLAAYAAAEADVRLAVAGQYPDISVGPGIGREQGVGRWTLGFPLPRIVVNRNRGPIAEAEARRSAAAARFEVIQQGVLADVAAAAAECAGARQGVVDADSLVAGTERRQALALAAYERGETGATEVAFARLARVRARGTRGLAARRLAAAGIALDRAVGTWLAGPAPHWPDVRESPREGALHP